MSDESTAFLAGELLRAIGEAEAPKTRVLEEAREVLWSVIATEMLGSAAAGTLASAVRGSTSGGEDERRIARRRRADRSSNERKTSLGGGDVASG
jgi:hypothetical protein